MICVPCASARHGDCVAPVTCPCQHRPPGDPRLPKGTTERERVRTAACSGYEAEPWPSTFGDCNEWLAALTPEQREAHRLYVEWLEQLIRTYNELDRPLPVMAFESQHEGDPRP